MPVMTVMERKITEYTNVNVSNESQIRIGPHECDVAQDEHEADAQDVGHVGEEPAPRRRSQ